MLSERPWPSQCLMPASVTGTWCPPGPGDPWGLRIIAGGLTTSVSLWRIGRKTQRKRSVPRDLWEFSPLFHPLEAPGVGCLLSEQSCHPCCRRMVGGQAVGSDPRAWVQGGYFTCTIMVGWMANITDGLGTVFASSYWSTGSKRRLLSKHWESPGIPDKAPWPLVLSLSRAGSELCDDVMGWRRMSRPLPVTVFIPPHVTTRNSGAGEGTETATHRGAQSGHKGSLSFRLNYFLKNNIKNKSWIEKPIDKMILGVKMPFSFVSKSMNTKNSGVISFGCICLRSPQLLLFLFMYPFWRFIDFCSKLMHLEIKR